MGGIRGESSGVCVGEGVPGGEAMYMKMEISNVTNEVTYYGGV